MVARGVELAAAAAGFRAEAEVAFEAEFQAGYCWRRRLLMICGDAAKTCLPLSYSIR